MRRPRRPAAAGCTGGQKAAPEGEPAVGVEDAEGVLPVIAVCAEGEASVEGVAVVAAAAAAAAAAGGGAGEDAPLEERVAVGVKDAEGVAVIGVDEGEDEVPARGDPVVGCLDRKVEAPVAKKDEEGIWLKHYSSMQSILIVGDGDFSFSLALATAFGSGGNLVATSLDSYEALTNKYGKAESNVMELKRLGAAVLHGVDAKFMKLHICLKMRRFDRIVFNFPHAGFKGKEDEAHMINSHKELVKGFFGNARHLLRPYGETHLSHKTGHPYDAWDVVQLASESCLMLVDRVDFCKEDFPGYNQKRGDSAKCDQPFALDPCCTFKFRMGDIKKLKKVCGNRIVSISSCGDNEVFPGILATDMRPFDQHALGPAWPRPHFLHMPITLEPYSIPGPPVNVLLTQGGIPPPMRITSSSLLAPHEQPWYPERPFVELLGRGDCSYSAWEHQRNRLHREYEIQRQIIPGGTSLGYLVFLEHRFRESVEKQKRLEMLIEYYGRQ